MAPTLTQGREVGGLPFPLPQLLGGRRWGVKDPALYLEGLLKVKDGESWSGSNGASKASADAPQRGESRRLLPSEGSRQEVTSTGHDRLGHSYLPAWPYRRPVHLGLFPQGLCGRFQSFPGSSNVHPG